MHVAFGVRLRKDLCGIENPLLLGIPCDLNELVSDVFFLNDVIQPQQAYIPYLYLVQPFEELVEMMLQLFSHLYLPALVSPDDQLALLEQLRRLKHPDKNHQQWLNIFYELLLLQIVYLSLQEYLYLPLKALCLM